MRNNTLTPKIAPKILNAKKNQIIEVQDRVIIITKKEKNIHISHFSLDWGRKSAHLFLIYMKN